MLDLKASQPLELLNRYPFSWLMLASYRVTLLLNFFFRSAIHATTNDSSHRHTTHLSLFPHFRVRSLMPKQRNAKQLCMYAIQHKCSVASLFHLTSRLSPRPFSSASLWGLLLFRMQGHRGSKQHLCHAASFHSESSGRFKTQNEHSTQSGTPRWQCRWWRAAPQSKNQERTVPMWTKLSRALFNCLHARGH